MPPPLSGSQPGRRRPARRGCGSGGHKVRDTEELVIKSSDIDEIIAAIDGGDEEIGINAFGQDGKILGWFGILPYEATDIVFDYSANAFCDSVMECVEEVSDDNAY